MSDPNDSTDSDSDEEYSIGEDFTDLLSEMHMLTGSQSFDTGIEQDLSKERELAIRLIKASEAIDQLTDYMEDNDISLEDMDTTSLDNPEIALVMWIIGESLERFATVASSYDDSNPFKVSDGDDPIY